MKIVLETMPYKSTMKYCTRYLLVLLVCNMISIQFQGSLSQLYDELSPLEMTKLKFQRTFQNTAGIRVGPGGHDRTLAVKENLI